jgi:hypothetical protein
MNSRFGSQQWFEEAAGSSERQLRIAAPVRRSGWKERLVEAAGSNDWQQRLEASAGSSC